MTVARREPLPGKILAVVIRLVCMGVSAFAVLLVFRKLDLPALQRVLLHARLSWLVAAVLMFGFGCGLSGARWHLMLLLKSCPVHSGVSVRLAFIGHFFNTLLFGPSGGDIAKAALYCRWYQRLMPEVLSACLLDRLLGLAGLVLFGMLAFALALAAHSIAPLQRLGFSIPMKWVWIAGAAAGCTLVGMMVRRRFYPESFVSRTLEALLAGGRQLLARPRLAAKGLLAGLVVQIAMASVLALCLRAVSHGALPWGQLVWTFPMISLVSAVPLTFSGSGLREGAALVCFGLYGVPGPDAVAAALLTFAIHTFW
jgi:uncharacterized membrane protein YbhN (UPF0104 family)